MRIGRNDKCHCGSGLKFKMCCLKKEKAQPNLKNSDISQSSILSTIRYGLENINAFEEATKKIRVKDVLIKNDDALQINFYSYSTNTIDIKLEIVTIMGFLSGFFKDDSFNFEFRFYAAMAFDKNDKVLISAISSKQTAELAGSGNSIEWLKSTLFIENTADHRLSVAKRIISEIETSIRYVIKDILSKEYGADWWDLSLNNRLGLNVKETYSNQFGEEIAEGNILINYTYLLQLKKIVSTHWPLFKNLFNTKVEFENHINQLNKIRREEAHNRVITEDHISDLNDIYTHVLATIAKEYIDLLPSYLIENWHFKIKSIMIDTYKPIYDENELVNEPKPLLKLTKSINSTLNLISYLDNIILRLESIIPPIQKKNVHDKLIFLHQKNKELHEEKLNYIKIGEIDKIQSTLKLIEKHQTKMNKFAENFLLTET